MTDNQPILEIETTVQAVPQKSDGGYRPQTFPEFIGNELAKRRLQIAVSAAQQEQRMPPHIMLYGNAGCGKTTLATIAAKALGAEVKTITGGMINTEMDLFKLLKELWQWQQEGKKAVLVIDEIHGLGNSAIPQEAYFPLLEDFIFYHGLQGREWEHSGHFHSNPLEADGHAHEILHDKILLQPFTCIGMTTDPALLVTPMRDRFGLSVRLMEYTVEELTTIMQLHAEHRLQLTIASPVATAIADRARGNPRVGINILRECYDRAVVDQHIIDEAIVSTHCELMGIYPGGFTKDDYQYLLALATQQKGLSILSLSSVVRIHPKTLETMIEPFLKYKRLVDITNRRHITQEGLNFLAERGLIAPRQKAPTVQTAALII